MPAYTVCIWVPCETDKNGVWEDTYSFNFKKEAQEEIEFAHSHEPRGWAKIIATNGTMKDLLEKRDAIPAPKGWKIDC